MLRALTKSVAGRAIGLAVVAVLLAACSGSSDDDKQAGQNDAAEAAEVGDCLNLSGVAVNAGSEAISCDDPTATYVVTATDGTCDEYEVEYSISAAGESKEVAACLTYNAKVGDCFVDSTLATPAKKVACQGEGADIKVLAFDDNSSKAKECPKKTTFSLPNKTRNQLLCFGKV
ncbi:LppU/SCO3897 family protein [Nocardioides sp. GXZ039]|uniref:LppU/SCO3897 family protein n=1 Tax=Nocardioides sp. GXZ039 TaxID=3136018 RepID=UPI0030F3B993